ncbi:MAG: hypothetical protein U9N02_00545 [Campylobacterota bacterium]|nr:hypothetical protein [Campylobacterota bacterium]
MKIWISDIEEKAYRLVKLNCAEHSDYKYIGDLDDKEIRSLLLELQNDIDIEKNIKLLNYYGYLNLFIISKK